MNFWITCMGVTNISLDDELREALGRLAVDMVTSGKKTASFVCASGEGRARKIREYVPFLGDGGPLFIAEVETAQGKGKTTYILSGNDLDMAVAAEQSGQKSGKAMYN